LTGTGRNKPVQGHIAPPINAFIVYSTGTVKLPTENREKNGMKKEKLKVSKFRDNQNKNRREAETTK